MIIKRKGQIVPKRFVKAVEKKSQHQVKFGCDVEIVGNTIYPTSKGSVIEVPNCKYCNLKKNKKRVKGFIFDNVFIDGSRLNGQTTAFSFDYQPSFVLLV